MTNIYRCTICATVTALVLLVAGSPAAAQTATTPIAETADATPEHGMSTKVFAFAVAGQAADIVTTEIGLSRGAREGNSLMGRRGVRIPVKLALPVLDKILVRALPRSKANQVGIITAAFGFGPAGWNVWVAVKGRKSR